MWKFSSRRDETEQHSLSYRYLWRCAFCVPVPHIYPSVGYCVVLSIAGSFHNLLTDKRKSAPHFLCIWINHLLGAGGEKQVNMCTVPECPKLRFAKGDYIKSDDGMLARVVDDCAFNERQVHTDLGIIESNYPNILIDDDVIKACGFKYDINHANYKVKVDDIVRFTIPESVEPEIKAENIPLDIIYEDADFLIVNKPKNMVVHPAPGHYEGTLVNAIMYHCKEDLSGINGVMRPGIVHRIDKDTTGSLIICKNDEAHNDISAQLKEHSITRKYRAIVHGCLKDDEGIIDAPIGRHPTDRKKMAINERNGKRAVTHYKVLERFQKYTYIECQLETGRTHQIRVHMASIGHPLLGDEVYCGIKSPFSLEGQCLHAKTIGFMHPRTHEYVEFDAPLPKYFEELLKKLK